MGRDNNYGRQQFSFLYVIHFSISDLYNQLEIGMGPRLDICI